MMTTWRRVVIGAGAFAVIGAGLGLVASAGPLDPPSGPVSPTGRTLEEIFSAAQGAGSNNLGVPGTARAAGATLVATFGAGGQQTFSVKGYSVKNGMVFSGGGGGSYVPQRGTLTVTVDLNKMLARPATSLAQATIVSSVVLTVPAGPETMVMTLTSVRVASITHYSLPRGDGQVAQLADIELEYVSQSTNMAGQSWQFP